MTINSKDLENIVKAIAKAVGFDTRTYLNESNTDTHNALIHLRGDYINTNIRNMVIAGKDNLELKHFKRFPWMGVFIIDRENQVTINVSSRGTIDRIKNSRITSHPCAMFLTAILFLPASKLRLMDLNFQTIFPRMNIAPILKASLIWRGVSIMPIIIIP